MRDRRARESGSRTVCIAAALLMAALFIVLGVRLKAIQLEWAADASDDMRRQSTRRVQTEGERGRILDRNGEVLAANRRSISIAIDAEPYKRRTWQATAEAMAEAIAKAEKIVGRESSIEEKDILRHLKRKLARPLVIWRDVDEITLAKFSEHEDDLPGFSIEEGMERIYPNGAIASHLIGYVGRDRSAVEAGDEKFNFYDLEMRGRSGLEYFYDSFLKGVPGEEDVTVDARGFARKTIVVIEAKKGPDLKLNLDIRIQEAAEKQLEGVVGACVVLDPRDGGILAMASSPRYDLNKCVPILRKDHYAKLLSDPNKPLLNRATGGGYAPGSTFKPITAIAGMEAGIGPRDEYECIGSYRMGEFKIRCARTWGHGYTDLHNALRDSCNTYFCNIGMLAGTNALISAARTFGLGAKTGIDFPVDFAGVVPDAVWKKEHYGTPWYPGDLAQAAIGQGMLMVSPLQMARVTGAIGVGYLVTPCCKLGNEVEKKQLPYSEEELNAVREGMRRVVNGGTGKRGAEDVRADVIGKTGTAEVGRGETRRKNTWFVAFAKGNGESRRNAADAMVAVALVVENGESGGSTAAPRVCEILKAVFNEA